MKKHNRAEQIEKRLPKWGTNEHVFVCFMDSSDKKVMRLDLVMRRHHIWLDYSRLEVSPKKALAHCLEYADLMEYVCQQYWGELKKAGYKEERGDSVGAEISSSRKPYLVYRVGGLK